MSYKYQVKNHFEMQLASFFLVCEKDEKKRDAKVDAYMKAKYPGFSHGKMITADYCLGYFSIPPRVLHQ